MDVVISRKNGRTSVKINGVEFNSVVSELKLHQEGCAVPSITLTVPIDGDMKIDLPDGVIIVEKETLAYK